MPPRLAVAALLLTAACAGSTAPSATPAPTTTTVAPTTTVFTYADACAQEGGTQGYSAATGVRVCEIEDVILFRRDPGDPVGFKQRCENEGGEVEGVTGTRPCMLRGISWFTPHDWDDPATERYTFDDG